MDHNEVDTVLALPAGHPWDAGREVAGILIAAGFETYAAGGCVRDLLLAHPVHDIDLATAAHPEQVEAVFHQQGWQTIAVGKAFGVVVVVTPGGVNIEVATFRTDGAYIDGRRPSSVIFSTAREDVERRDFTINGLLCDLRSGAVIDHVGGRSDLDRGIVRAVGDPVARLREDRLRVLRGLRFAARFSFTIEPATWSAMIATPLSGLSGERLMQELTKALSGPGRSHWMGLLRASGHLASLCPPLAQCTTQDLDAMAHRLDRCEERDPFALRLAIWLSPLPVARVRPWLIAQPLPNVMVRRCQWLLEHARLLPAMIDRPLAYRRRLWRHEDGPWLARLIAVLHDAPAQSEAVRTLLAEAEHDFQVMWTPWVRADDLMGLGLPPGPRLGALLRELEDADLEGRFTHKAAAMAFARARLITAENPQANRGQSDQGAR